MESGLVSIGSDAFNNCQKLTDVKLPDTLVSVSDWCFYNCESLAVIRIPKKVSHIDYHAFYNCHLTEIRFEGNAPVIEAGSFYHYNTTINAYYPKDDATWTDEIFNGSYGASFKWIPYEPSLSTDEEAEVFVIAQGSCGVNVSWMIMSDGRLIIFGNGAMQFMMRSGAAPWSAYADMITSIEVTSGVESIADNAFSDCGNATTVTVADTVTSVGAEAFAGCDSLETVTFTGDAPMIGANAFNSVEAIVQYPANNNTWNEGVQEDFCGDITWVEDSCQALGTHKFDQKVAGSEVAATCTSNGSVIMSCKCGATETKVLSINKNNHVYKDGTCSGCGKSDPNYSNVVVSEDCSTMTITYASNKNLKNVQFAVWSEAGGQDDLKWYTAEYVSGKWRCTVDLTAHKTKGKYQIHAYSIDGGVYTRQAEYMATVNP